MTRERNLRQAHELPIAVSHPDKLFWPEQGYTKLDLIEYYDMVFPKMQPFIRDRMLSLERCPEGLRGSCFFQKEMPAGMPAGTRTKRIRHERSSVSYVVGGSKTTLLTLVNLGCITFHVSNGRASRPRQPDWMCFDLDPETGGFPKAVHAALLVKEGLDSLGLVSFIKASGSRGLHLFVPIQVGPTNEEVLAFAQPFLKRLADAHPNDLTVEQRRTARGDRVYLDRFRNSYAQTVVSPYSVRHRPRAPVSTPLNWSELKSTLHPADFNIGNFAKRLAGSDPWREFFERRQSLNKAMKALKGL